MKTLDEVIAELEDEGLFADALHYLKEYKANQEDPDGDHQQLEKSRALLQDFYRNDPLSWNELKQMKGKPVWVEANDGQYKGWVIVGKFYSLLEKEDLDAHVDLYYFGRSMEYSKEMYGYYWQAYRKERGTSQELRNISQFPNVLFRPEGMYCAVCGSRLDQDPEEE